MVSPAATEQLLVHVVSRASAVELVRDTFKSVSALETDPDTRRTVNAHVTVALSVEDAFTDRALNVHAFGMIHAAAEAVVLLQLAA